MCFRYFFFETQFSEYLFVDQTRSETVAVTFLKYPRIIGNLILSSMLGFDKNIMLFNSFFVTCVCDAGQHGFQIHTAPTRQHTQ